MNPALRRAVRDAQRVVLDPKATNVDVQRAIDDVERLGDEDATYSVRMMVGERTGARVTSAGSFTPEPGAPPATNPLARLTRARRGAGR